MADVGVSTPTSDNERDETTEDQMETQKSENASQSLEQETRSIPEDTNARKIFIQEVSRDCCDQRVFLTAGSLTNYICFLFKQKAMLLRNTLQTAMRNVTSHHFDRRVSELEAHSREHPRN